jgi:dTDP-4-amino-4,6-dideoxygalactose transaminase
VASANCARFCGATVDFVDIDPTTLNMSTEALAAKLSHAAALGALPKVVIPVHFAGLPCDLAGIHALAKRYGFRVIEDASHAIGATYGDSVIGDCRFSDITVFSFHPVKIITTGEGGMAATQSDELAHAMRLLRSHGVTRDPAQLQDGKQGAWYYEQLCLGFNYRMTELQGALGRSQLGNLAKWIRRRHELADLYDEQLAAQPLILPQRPANSVSALHLYVVQLDPARTPVTRRTAFDRLRAAGVGVNVHYIPVHTQPDFRALGFRDGDFPMAETYYARCLSLPMFAALSETDQSRVVTALRQALA